MDRIDGSWITTADERSCQNDSCQYFGTEGILEDQSKGGDPEVEVWKCQHCSSRFKIVKFGFREMFHTP